MEAIIFIGIPASGKSTFYLHHFFDTHLRINLDMLRTRRREQLLIQACIAARQRFVVDNTNVTRADRVRYILPAKEAGFKVVGYYFQSTLGGSIGRNRGRAPERTVPEKGIAAKYHRLQPPAFEEGFDQLFSVTLGPDGAFAVLEWAGSAPIP